MKESITINFIVRCDEVVFYFEIQGASVALCKVVSGDNYNVMTIKKVCISLNPEYASWLKYHSGTYYKDTESEDTELNHLFTNNHWFVSNHHSNFDKYINELKYHMEELGE
ncbi:MAG: hypothetical protein NTY55_02950 [Flavobacteriia bacterium]|nr:hypothetical protein [Flavobacteriia bacterium]